MTPSNIIPSDNVEIEKSKVFSITEFLEYIPNSVLIKTIINKTTGNISAVSFDSEESFTEKISRFDTLIQVIDGRAKVIINGHAKMLETGQSIVIPAHTRNTISAASMRFKMISTVIKSGYDM